MQRPPTEMRQGCRFIKRGVAMFDELQQGVRDIASLADPTAGEVRMGGSEHTVSAIYSPVVQRFAAQYPRMSFHIIVGDLHMMSRELDARHIDFHPTDTPCCSWSLALSWRSG
jgi:DNA-binding transcriptional LysR family regulator